MKTLSKQHAELATAAASMCEFPSAPVLVDELNAIAQGRHCVIETSLLKAAIEALSEYTSTCETLDALTAALAEIEEKLRDA